MAPSIFRDRKLRTGMTRDEASRRVTEWEAGYEQAKVKFEQMKEEAKVTAREVANAAARATSQAAFWGFIAMAIGVLAARRSGRAAASPDDIAIALPTIAVM